MTAPIPISSPSTGACPAEWRAWWKIESRRCGSDWHGVLYQHQEALRRLQSRAVSS
jgi:hypothetical protein